MSRVSDEALGALADALDSFEVGQVQGFHYPPQYVIRDCMRKPGNQVVWTGPDTDEPTFRRQCEIERMRVAVGLWLAKAPGWTVMRVLEPRPAPPFVFEEE